MKWVARVLGLTMGLLGQWGGGTAAFPAVAEFHFVRMEYRDLPGMRRFGGGRDWPKADAHFAQGVRRLTRIDNGVPIHLPLTDNGAAGGIRDYGANVYPVIAALTAGGGWVSRSESASDGAAVAGGLR